MGTKDDEDISKFSKEAMTLGDDMCTLNDTAPTILKKVFLLYDKYVGENKVFPTKKWSTTHHDQIQGHSVHL